MPVKLGLVTLALKGIAARFELRQAAKPALLQRDLANIKMGNSSYENERTINERKRRNRQPYNFGAVHPRVRQLKNLRLDCVGPSRSKTR